MSQKKAITVTIDPDVLARIDRVADLRGESRSAVFERLARNGVEDEEKFLDVIGGPVAGKIITAMLGNPKLHGMLAKLLQEEVSPEELARIQERAPEVRDAGQKHRQEKKGKKS